jgi:AcrR family transcriptional regulator
VADHGKAARKDVVRNRARLLEAADELVAQHGVSIGLDAVARHAGVGAGTAYRHFPTKAALLAALFERRLDALEELIKEAADAPDPYEALRDYVFNLSELQSGDLGLWQAVAVPVDGPDPVRARLLPHSERLVARAQQTGRLRPDFTVTDLAMITWTAGALNERLGPLQPRIWRRYLAAMLDGFASPDEPQRPLPVPALTPDQMQAVVHAWLPPNPRR